MPADLEKLGKRLFQKDRKLWTDDPEIRNRLGWIDVIEPMRGRVAELRAFADEVRAAGYTRTLLLGMGGSSLCPEVLASVYGSPALRVLDSTVPAAVRAADEWSRAEKTLFIVASKSGSTIEVSSFYRYFAARGGEHFVAITDPGTSLEALAREAGFRRTFLNWPDIGGRYSALSYFGMVPAALIGADPEALLAAAGKFTDPESPAMRLGSLLNEAMTLGRDKLTFVMNPKIESLGSWIEQLVAESTGKEETGVLPIEGESIGAPAVYGDDRLFVCIDREEEARQLARAGLAVMRFGFKEPAAIGGEFYRWEIATAVVGSLLGINPFDEPNVRESKALTKEMLDGGFPDESPVAEEDGIRLYADGTLGGGGGVRDWLAAHVRRREAGDYFAVLAYLHRTDPTHRELQAIRLAVRNRRRLATTLGYGPRYLHSTGQFHKGGPNTGLFLMITADDGAELPIPGEPFGFSRLKQAQAVGDFHALARRGRRIVRVHLSGDVGEALRRLREHVDAVA